jgi:[acyl-carrier-protein] S-malonyltransferase
LAAAKINQVAWVFPGQGSQRVGMGRELAANDPRAAETFEVADKTLGFPLSDIIFGGPDEVLQQTPMQQPAILTVSVAFLRVLQARDLLPGPAFVAGHSLGEYAALVAARALDFRDALRLVRRRGELMQRHGAGAMAALLGLPRGAVVEIAAETGVEVANFNAPDQITVSGRRESVNQAVVLARDRGAKRAIVLPVSAAFHSSLMAPVVDEMRSAIENVLFRSPDVPLVGNVDARVLSAPDELRQELLDQICAPVQWVDSVRVMSEAGVTTFFEIGPGKVLSGLVGRCAPTAATTTAEALLMAG